MPSMLFLGTDLSLFTILMDDFIKKELPMSINLASKNGGFALYQKDTEKRLPFNEFIRLILFLKQCFPHTFVIELYPGQSAWVFHGSQSDLQSKINLFLNRMNFEQSPSKSMGSLYLIN